MGVQLQDHDIGMQWSAATMCFFGSWGPLHTRAEWHLSYTDVLTGARDMPGFFEVRIKHKPFLVTLVSGRTYNRIIGGVTSPETGSWWL